LPREIHDRDLTKSIEGTTTKRDERRGKKNRGVPFGTRGASSREESGFSYPVISEERATAATPSTKTQGVVVKGRPAGR
jgi:hypothetical protein